MLPGAAARHRSAGPSFVACAGGLVSTSAAGVAIKSRRFGGPAEKLSKESYALALEEQIASRKLQCVADKMPAPPLLDAVVVAPLERAMGQRNGGPMAPAPKERYALALRAQIETRDARRAAEAEAGKVRDAGDVLFGPGGAEAAILGGRRRHGAPPLPSKESYAMELVEQMATRSVQQAAEASRAREPMSWEEDVVDEVPLGKGKRPTYPTKSLYASELQHQIAARKAQQAADVEPLLGGFLGGDDAFSGRVELARGKRQASTIDHLSKESYSTALQDQMAERAAQRAANAFHVQATLQGAPLHVQEDSPRGGRRKCDMPAATKESYALALQEQIAERKAQRNGYRANCAGAVQASFVGGDASDMGPVRGRRHAGQISASSKEEYRLDLQRQMDEREFKEAGMKFRAQVPDPTSADGFIERMRPSTDQDLLQRRDGGASSDSLERLLAANVAHASCAY